MWDSVAALNAYVYKSGHVEIMRRRREWFGRMAEAGVVLWWVPRGQRPSIEEALSKLAHLRQHGPTRFAFTFREAYPQPDQAASHKPVPFQDECPAT